MWDGQSEGGEEGVYMEGRKHGKSQPEQDKKGIQAGELPDLECWSLRKMKEV